MKKLYFLIILASMAFLIGCGPDPKPPEDDQPPPCVGDECEDAPPAPPDPPEPDPEPPPEPQPEPAPEPEPEPAPAPEPEADPEPEKVQPDIELNRADLKEQKKEQEKEEELIVEEKDADQAVQPPKPGDIIIMPPDDPDTAFSEMGMVYFAYDKSEITAEFEEVIQKNYEWIFQNPDAQVQLEGHCDERGTNEYNLALGERRAKAVFDYLVSLGANPSQFTIVSFGEERPVAYGSNEASWRQNRRVEFTRL